MRITPITWGMLMRNSPSRVGHAHENGWGMLVGNDNLGASDERPEPQLLNDEAVDLHTRRNSFNRSTSSDGRSTAVADAFWWLPAANDQPTGSDRAVDRLH